MQDIFTDAPYTNEFTGAAHISEVSPAVFSLHTKRVEPNEYLVSIGAGNPDNARVVFPDSFNCDKP
jgi:hypothetical protein